MGANGHEAWTQKYLLQEKSHYNVYNNATLYPWMSISIISKIISLLPTLDVVLSDNENLWSTYLEVGGTEVVPWTCHGEFLTNYI